MSLTFIKKDVYANVTNKIQVAMSIKSGPAFYNNTLCITGDERFQIKDN